MDYESKEAVERMGNMVEEVIDRLVVDVPASKVYILQAAQTRLTELRVLLSVAVSTTVPPFHHTLEPLRNAVTQVLAGLEETTTAEIDESLDDEDLEAVLIIKEDATTRLEQANVNALCMLAHMNNAVRLLNKQRLEPK